MGSNGLGGSGGAGKNGARVTYELTLVTNEYTACGERTRGVLRMESACAERRAAKSAAQALSACASHEQVPGIASSSVNYENRTFVLRRSSLHR